MDGEKCGDGCIDARGGSEREEKQRGQGDRSSKRVMDHKRYEREGNNEIQEREEGGEKMWQERQSFHMNDMDRDRKERRDEEQ